MDKKRIAINHVKSVLQPIGLHDAADLCERIYLDQGDRTASLHPASVLAHAHELAQQPLGGDDAAGQLSWQIYSPRGLPEVLVSLTLDGRGSDHFTTNAPFHELVIERDYYAQHNQGHDDVYRHLVDLEDDDRDTIFQSMAEDATEYAQCYMESIQIRHWQGWGAVLRDAAKQGNLDAIQDAIGIGVSPRHADEHGITALHLAAQHGHAKLLAPLIQAGADPNAQDKDGRTPLHYAAKERFAMCCLALMANGASPTVQDQAGRTPSARVHERSSGYQASL